MSAIELLAQALAETGWRLWSTALNNTPDAQRVRLWMKSIAPGHLVLEISGVRDRGAALDRVGELVSITGNDCYTIRTFDDREHRWENAMFVRLPRNRADHRELEE